MFASDKLQLRFFRDQEKLEIQLTNSYILRTCPNLIEVNQHEQMLETERFKTTCVSFHLLDG